MTRKVIVYELLSLDGVAEAPEEFFTDFDDPTDDDLGRVIASQDVVLLGRRTYDIWARFWPTSDIQPFANFINRVQKHVVTSTEPEASWANSTVMSGDLAEFVTELKEQSGGDIGVHGSISVAQSLLAMDLVDELRLVIAPVVHVTGRKLFDGGVPRKLALTRTLTSPSGHLMLDYTVHG